MTGIKCETLNYCFGENSKQEGDYLFQPWYNIHI